MNLRIFLLIMAAAAVVPLNAQLTTPGKSMIIEVPSKYSFSQTVELLTGEAGEKSWNVPVVHDLQKSLAKSGRNVRPVTVIEICKPEYSGKLLELNSERIISVFMPCRLSVYEKNDGKAYVAFINGELLAADQPGNISEVMKAASDEISEIVKIVTR